MSLSQKLRYINSILSGGRGRKKGLGSARHYIGGGYVFEVEEKGGGQKQTRGRGAADDGHRGEGESVGGGEASFFACCERLCK